MENRLETSKNEIAQSEDKKITLLQEYENRVDFYRNLYEEETKQKQNLKEKIENHITQLDTFQQKIEEAERIIEQMKVEMEDQHQILAKKEKEGDALQQENQRLILAVNSLVDKVYDESIQSIE